MFKIYVIAYQISICLAYSFNKLWYFTWCIFVTHKNDSYVTANKPMCMHLVHYYTVTRLRYL